MPSTVPERRTALSFEYLNLIKGYLESQGKYIYVNTHPNGTGRFWEPFFEIVQCAEDVHCEKCSITLDNSQKVHFDMQYIFKGHNFNLKRVSFVEAKGYLTASIGNLNSEFKKFICSVYKAIDVIARDYEYPGYNFVFYCSAPFSIMVTDWNKWNDVSWLRTKIAERLTIDEDQIDETLLSKMINKIQVEVLSWNKLKEINGVE